MEGSRRPGVSGRKHLIPGKPDPRGSGSPHLDLDPAGTGPPKPDTTSTATGCNQVIPEHCEWGRRTPPPPRTGRGVTGRPRRSRTDRGNPNPLRNAPTQHPATPPRHETGRRNPLPLRNAPTQRHSTPASHERGRGNPNPLRNTLTQPGDCGTLRTGSSRPVRIASDCCYTTPWSIIASATLRKPAMLAPTT